MATADAYLVGGGIASLAAAAFLIRDAGYAGERIHLFELADVPGGSLDGAGNANDGYVIRGGRMFEAHFGCTFDLLSGVPTLAEPSVSVTEDIKRFTDEVVPSSKCRLVIDGARVTAPEFELSMGDKRALLALTLRSEKSLGKTTIAEYFSPHFLETNYWTMWCTMFAFQSWHGIVEMRRYMRRFMHLLPGFNRLEGIHRTRLNQYDSIVRPLAAWLTDQGVAIELNTPVTAIEFDTAGREVIALSVQRDGQDQRIEVDSDDRTFITLGSMTEGSSLGSMTTPPARREPAPLGSWALWEQIARTSPHFGHPERFAADTDKTLWESFTVTLRDPEFFEFMESFTANPAGTGGLVTFKNSGWLMSVVLAHQPHFADQEEDAWVFWGYGLHPHQPGDAITKPMWDCTGAEILAELAHQLRLNDQSMFATANCIPCLMPHITAQFMPRLPGDRPKVVPPGATNFAFLGQFCEIPDDTVFTVEYSVRSAQMAVYQTCGVKRPNTPLYRGFEKPRVLASALTTLLRNGRTKQGAQ
jgi:oleate hydratase